MVHHLALAREQPAQPTVPEAPALMGQLPQSHT